MQDIDAARSEALTLAVELFARREDPMGAVTEAVLDAAGLFLSTWLRARPASITAGNPVISEQADPARTFPSTRGADMAVTIKDTDIATYPAADALDTKGFEVSDSITVSEDSGGTVVTLVSNEDGTATATAVAPGAVQLTWSDGTISFADTLNVTAGDVASIVVGAPVITSQIPAEAPAEPPADSAPSA